MRNHPSPDEGLQVERTSLASMRTALSILALAAGCLRWLPSAGPAAVAGPALAGLIVVGVTVGERRGHRARLQGFRNDTAAPATLSGALLAASIVLLSFSGLLSLLS